MKFPAALTNLAIDNRFTRLLPADPLTSNECRQVPAACFSRVTPRPSSQPQLVCASSEAAALLGLTAADLQDPAFVQLFAGNQILPGMDPHAMRYGGHQFGNWAGQLGDGRAINLAEVRNPAGEHWTLQLKGAGPTPYSRTADGLAVLRSSLREFLCSEAMAHLGVPTTRALSLILTGDQVMRDMFYDGHPAPEPGAVVCRMAPSFLRFGNYQILAHEGDLDLLRKLLDYTIDHHFPHHRASSGNRDYGGWFREVCDLTLIMIVHWMRVGFVHGVMNTDNMSVLGLTIDYGPYGWMDNYDPDWTPNTTDAGGRRYRFGQQPAIAQWNLLQLANAIYPIVGTAQPLEDALAEFAQQYGQRSVATLGSKLGLTDINPDRDRPLISDLQTLLQEAEVDMTIFFRLLSESAVETLTSDSLRPAFYTFDDLPEDLRARFDGWLVRYRDRARQAGADPGRAARMEAVNPRYVLRNYLAQQAIDRATSGDFEMVHELLAVLRQPYTRQPQRDHYFARRPDWARNRPGCSMLSCSS